MYSKRMLMYLFVFIVSAQWMACGSGSEDWMTFSIQGSASLGKGPSQSQTWSIQNDHPQTPTADNGPLPQKTLQELKAIIAKSDFYKGMTDGFTCEKIADISITFSLKTARGDFQQEVSGCVKGMGDKSDPLPGQIYGLVEKFIIFSSHHPKENP